MNGNVNFKQFSNTLVSKVVLPKQPTEVSATGLVEDSHRNAPQEKIRSIGRTLNRTIVVNNWSEQRNE